MSIKEDSAEDFLTKLGLITKMIDDVTQFRIRMKRSRSRLNTDTVDGQEEIVKGGHKMAKKEAAAEDGLYVGAVEAMMKLKKKAKYDELLSHGKKPITYYKTKSNRVGAKRMHKEKANKDEIVSLSNTIYFLADFITSYQIIISVIMLWL